MSRTLLLTVALLCVLTSCKKNGTGGDATIVAFPEHHGRAIKGSTMFVKFNAKDLPPDPTNNYDLKIQGEANEDHVHIEDLLPGNYYLYAVGFDSTIMQNVKGGYPASVSKKDKKKEIDLHIAVTE